MPTWTTCYANVVLGRVAHRWRQSPLTWDSELAVEPLTTIRGPRTPGEALVYSYAYLHHHVGAARAAFELEPTPRPARPECTLIDYGCGPATALMAFAESAYARAQAPLKVHYLGCDTRNCQAIDIAHSLFECIRAEGLITADSTCAFAPVDQPLPYPALLPSGHVYFALCYLLAHDYFSLVPPVAGEPARPDRVRELGDAIRVCRNHYARPLHLVYVNPWNGPWHGGWARLTHYLQLPMNRREQAFTYPVYDSNLITGRTSLENWRAQRFNQAARLGQRGTAACDFVVMP